MTEPRTASPPASTQPSSAADPRFPIGKFSPPSGVTEAQRGELLAQVAQAPAQLRAAVRGLSEAQLQTPYREGGWTVRQVVHHVADSHMNAYVRFKLALTENEPTIKPYEEARWAELSDSATVPIETSLDLLQALHERWVALMRSMSAEDWRRAFMHPEHKRLVPLDQSLALYAWHGRHHTAHVTALRQAKSW